MQNNRTDAEQNSWLNIILFFRFQIILQDNNDQMFSHSVSICFSVLYIMFYAVLTMYIGYCECLKGTVHPKNGKFLSHTMEVNGVHQLSDYQHYLKYFLLCSAEERNTYRFGTNKWWQNFLFWVNYCIPLMSVMHMLLILHHLI